MPAHVAGDAGAIAWANGVDTNKLDKSEASSTYVPKAATASAGSFGINISPANVIGAADMYTVFGGSTAFPNKIDGTGLANVSGYDNWILGGSIANVNHSHHSTTGGASGHAAALSGSYLGVFGGYGVVAGGTQNWVTADQGAVLGGRQNAVATAVTTLTVQANPADTTITTTVALVAGRTVYLASTGSQNAVEVFTVASIAGLVSTLSGPVAFVHATGGKVYSGDASVTDGTVGGGQSNQVTKTQGTIGGGFNNKVGGTAGSIGGGTSNTANTTASTVSGGDSNATSGTSTYGAIGGGQANSVTATGATVPGGLSNAATAKCAHAIGNASVASHHCESAQSAGAFAAVGDAQSSTLIARASITGAVTSEVFLDQSAARITLPDNTAAAFRIDVIGWDTTGKAVAGEWHIEGAIARATGVGSTVIFGTTRATPNASNVSGMDFTATADTTNGSLKLTATSVAGKRVFFVATVALTQTTG